MENGVTDRQELFKVIEPNSGKTYRVFTDGTAEGFDEDHIVINRYPQLVLSERHKRSSTAA